MNDSFKVSVTDSLRFSSDLEFRASYDRFWPSSEIQPAKVASRLRPLDSRFAEPVGGNRRESQVPINLNRYNLA